MPDPNIHIYDITETDSDYCFEITFPAEGGVIRVGMTTRSAKDLAQRLTKAIEDWEVKYGITSMS